MTGRLPADGAGPAPSAAFQKEVLAGLSRRPRRLPSRWFYDERGSLLFQWITRLPGYYLTRTELAILARHRAEIAAPLAGRRCTVVDLGAGDGHKTRVLVETLRARCPSVLYAPVDVSRAALDEAARRIGEEVPGVEVRPVLAEYGVGLRRLSRADDAPRLVLFLGSSIGNLEHVAAARLLRELRRAMRPDDHALVGFDLVKPLDALREAYDDPQGVTREFNLNLLARANRELGADFDLQAFAHRATWDPVRPAMESWLESLRAQVVRIAGRAFALEAGERIHTEISCKYSLAQLEALGREAGFTPAALFQDGQRWFADALWRVDGG